MRFIIPETDIVALLYAYTFCTYVAIYILSLRCKFASTQPHYDSHNRPHTESVRRLPGNNLIKTAGFDSPLVLNYCMCIA